MWSGCVRAAPDVVVAAGSRELEYFEYNLDDDDDEEEAEEAEYDEEEVTTAACAACSIGSDLPPPTVPNPATPSANASIPLPSAFLPPPPPPPPPPFKLKASSSSSSSSRRHDGPRVADDALKTVCTAGASGEREVKRGGWR